jgi:hypothetical protein
MYYLKALDSNQDAEAALQQVHPAHGAEADKAILTLMMAEALHRGHEVRMNTMPRFFRGYPFSARRFLFWLRPR